VITESEIVFIGMNDCRTSPQILHADAAEKIGLFEGSAASHKFNVS
jgi:hypothetical protein